MATVRWGWERGLPGTTAPFPEGFDFDLPQVGPSKGSPQLRKAGLEPKDGPWDQREVPQARSPQHPTMGEGLSGHNLGSDSLPLSVVVGIGFPPCCVFGSSCLGLTVPLKGWYQSGSPALLCAPLPGCLGSSVSGPCHLISPISVRLFPPCLELPFDERRPWICLPSLCLHLGPFSRWLSVSPAKCPEAFSGDEGASSPTLKPSRVGGREPSPPTPNLGPCLFLLLIPGTPHYSWEGLSGLGMTGWGAAFPQPG